MRDTQLVELKAKHRLIESLARAGIEVAIPLRDRGIDLVAYVELPSKGQQFAARPIQMKGSTGAFFGIDRKYERFPNLILAFVWHIEVPARTVVYALTYEDAVRVGDAMGYTRTASWKGSTTSALRMKRGAYSTTKPSQKLRRLLAPYRANPGRWQEIILS